MRLADGTASYRRPRFQNHHHLQRQAHLADINNKPGDFIVRRHPRPDGKIRAYEIRIFNGVRGEGQFPMAKPDQVMTNATVKEVMTNATAATSFGSTRAPASSSSSPSTAQPLQEPLTQPGRASDDTPAEPAPAASAKPNSKSPPTWPCRRHPPRRSSMLKPGAKVSVVVNVALDGAATATRITISE